jgi:CheY-like chemotaxis protein
MTTGATLEVALRCALNRLYDSVALRRSSLVALLGLGDRPNPSESLRTLLESEIQLLSGGSNAPASSKNHRYHQVLFYRYIQRFTQREVAAQLGIGPRHLRREQEVAIEYLADRLRQRHGLAGVTQFETTPAVDAHTASSYGDIDSEIEHLTDAVEERSSDLGAVLEECTVLTRTLAMQHRVEVQVHLGGTSSVAVAHAVLKQVILNLLAMAIRALDGGMIGVRARPDADQVHLTLTPHPAPHHAMPPIAWDEHALAISQRMAGLFQGEVAARDANGEMTLQLTLPLADHACVLAVEDNQDTLDLWQRYVRGSPFHLVPLRNPHDVLAQVERLQPDMIVLDIMLPEVDGWELLAELRDHRLGKVLPIVVCSVLPQRDLALSLGANGFLPKPATREQFLGVLQRLSAVAARR